MEERYHIVKHPQGMGEYNQPPSSVCTENVRWMKDGCPTPLRSLQTCVQAYSLVLSLRQGHKKSSTRQTSGIAILRIR